MPELATDRPLTLPVSLRDGTRAAFAFERCDARRISALEAELRDLETRLAEPNPMGNTDFLLAACRHFAENAAPHGLAVRDAGGVLVAFVPLAERRFDLAGAVQRLWQHPFSACGAPMIDAAQLKEVAASILDHLAHSGSTSLAMTQLAADGPTAIAFRHAAAQRGLAASVVALGSRAALKVPPSALDTTRASKERRRQRRRLSEKGSLNFEVVADYDRVRSSLETFLAIEARGWKGKRGTALLQNPGHANFARALIWSLAANARVQIAELRLGETVIASVIMLWSGSSGCLWKITYDEAYAGFSPGVHLLLDLRQWLVASGKPVLVDSCALPGQGMIERLWSHRIDICDLMIALDSQRMPAFHASVFRERLRRDLRARAKSVYNRLRQRAQMA